MNLVAKEFVSARDDLRGVLMLSEFAGAAHELSAALIVNPYAVEDTADALARALAMSEEEQAGRMSVLRAVVAEFNAFRWAADLLQDAERLGGQILKPVASSSRSCSSAARSVGPAVARDSLFPRSSGTAPTLEVRKLGRLDRGMIGLWVGNQRDGDCAAWSG